jgi:hypothetical protein
MGGIICEDCDLLIASRKKAPRHMKKVHQKERPFSCPMTVAKDGSNQAEVPLTTVTSPEAGIMFLNKY